MSNVIDMMKYRKRNNERPTNHMATTHIFLNADEDYEVSMEVNGEYEDEEIHHALMSVAVKYGLEHNLMEEDNEDENSSSYNDGCPCDVN